MSRYQKGKTNLDFTEARDSEWQWHQLGHMQVCTLLQTDNHASTPLLSFLQAGCPSCHPTNSVKALYHSIIVYVILLSAVVYSKQAMTTNRRITLVEIRFLYVFIPTSEQKRHAKWSHTTDKQVIKHSHSHMSLNAFLVRIILIHKKTSLISKAEHSA